MKKGGINGSPKQQSKSRKAAKLLDIYIRNNKKQALLVHTPSYANIQQISRAIRSRLGVPLEDQVLFHNGRRIQPLDNDEFLQLEDKAVIHLVDRRNIGRQITVNVRKLNVAKIEQFRIPSAQIIQDFIVRNISQDDPDKMFFAYTGRHLRKNKSFAEEYVQNESQLFCLHEDRDEVRGQRRKYYQRKIQEQKEKNEQKHNTKISKEEEEGDNVLFNYLPRERKDSEERSDQNQEVKPNFKKKHISKEINISGNTQPLKTSNVEGHLSIVNQNLLENHSGMGNSAYFNEGSSISEIVPDHHINPESSKKIQDGSMFQSAIMGLNNEPSQVAAKSPENDIQEENELEGSREKESFSFDARAPELLQAPDKQLTLLQREILEVTESQEEQSKEKNISSEEKIQEGSVQHSQFELGEVQNHMLSVSTEMKVEDPNSPLPRQVKNEILIEEEPQQNDPSEKDKHLQYANVEIQQVSNEPSESEDQKAEKRLNFDQEQFEFQEERSNQTPLLSQNPQQEEVDLFVIEQEGPPQTQNPTASQMIAEKEELETHGPSSSSNLYSKNSSRVKQFQPQPNEYEFGYSKPFNRPTTQSSCYETNLKSEQNLLDTPKSEKNDKSNSVVQQSKSHEKMEDDHFHKDYNDSDDMELLIVDPLDIKTNELAKDLMNFQSQLVVKSGIEAKQEKKVYNKQESNIKIRKEGSRIEELNYLLTDNSPKKAEEKEEHQQQSKESNLLSHESSVKQSGSDIKIDPCENEKQNQFEESENMSKESLELIRLKKTQGTASKAELILKNATDKFNLETCHYIFKNEVSYFDPFQFYLKLLPQESYPK